MDASKASHDLGEVENVAYVFLELLGIVKPPTPDNLVFSFDPSHPVVFVSSCLGRRRGALDYYNGYWLLHCNRGDRSAVQRFTRFHEGYHILEHVDPVLAAMRTSHAWGERLADHFAACILMPRRWMEERWPRVRDISRMAGMFWVSRGAMWHRLRELDLSAGPGVRSADGY